MSARTIDLPSHPSLSSEEHSGTTVRALMVAAIVAITLALVGAYAYSGARPDVGYPDPTQQWTD